MAKKQTEPTNPVHAGGWKLVNGRWVLSDPPPTETGPDEDVIDGGTP